MGDIGRSKTTDDRHNYSSTLSLCLLSSIGLCLAFLPDLPINQDNLSENGVRFTVARICMSVVIVIAEIQAIRFIRLKKRFHQGQVVFWPMRCRHCARALGVLRQPSSDVLDNRHGERTSCHDTAGIEQNNRCHNFSNSDHFDSSLDTGQTQTLLFLAGGNSSTTHLISRLDGSVSPHHRAPQIPNDGSPQNMLPSRDDGQAPQFEESTCSASPHLHDDVFPRRSRSLVNVFNVFAVLAIFTLPFIAVGKIICICSKQDDKSMNQLISEEIFFWSLLTSIPVAMAFSVKYYDAVFATNAENCYSIVIFLSGSILVWAVNVIRPIGSLLREDNLEDYCIMNGTFGHILHYTDHALTSFYMEVGIIATGILWQIWTSFVSKSFINLRRDMPQYDVFPKHPNNGSSSSLFTLMSRWRFYIKCSFPRRLEDNNIQQNLRQEEQRNGLKRFVSTTWILCSLASVTYLGFNVYLTVLSWTDVSRIRSAYVAWSVMCFPLFALLVYLFRISRHVPILEDRGPSGWQSRLEGHDVLLLMCTCGLFCQCFVRLTAATGLLFNGSYKKSDELCNVVLAIVYSIVTIVYIWSVTSFLLRIQRQNLTSFLEIKWVLATLVFIATTNGTQWLIDTIIVTDWPVQEQYFGTNPGMVIGVLLKPFTTLYGLHAAMIAYESFKVVLRKALQQRTCL